MSQQINLLRQKGLPATSVYLTMGLLIGGLVAVAAYAGVASQKLASVQGQLADAQKQAASMQSAILAAERARRAPDGIEALEAEITQLTLRTQQIAPLLASIQSGAAGDPQGYSRQLGMLASVPRSDVWLTGVDIPKSKQMQVMGRAMRNDQAVAYAKQLRDTFDPLGIRFNAIELRPEPLPGSPSDKPASVVNFKIS